jgi:putative nucleotidyltransferase with HDIG domain
VDEQSLLTRIVNATGDLPTMPHIANLVIERLAAPTTSPKEIHEIISKDQALAARVLRIANSPFYGYPRTVTRLTDAIVIMGFNSIRSLVLTSVFQDLFKSFGLTEKLLWEHSLVCASISQRIAKSTGLKKTEEAFLVGLMHDIGKVILNVTVPDKMSNIIQEVYNAQGTSFSEMEEEAFGFTHADVGRAIAIKWNFAKEIEEAIGNHHHPESAVILPSLSYIVHLANNYCHKLEIGPIKNPGLNLMELESTKALKLIQPMMNRLSEEISRMLESQQSSALF